MTPPQSPSIVPLQGRQEHLYWLDWLRFTGALMVVTTHCRTTNWETWVNLTAASQTKLVAIFFALTRTGIDWVILFFVLSGFLIGGKMMERLADGTFDLQSYVIDRFTRIWTPLIPALILSGITACWLGKPASWLDLGGNLVGLQGTLFPVLADNLPLWSLSYEIWFYFLAACVAALMMTGTRGRIAAVFGLAMGFAVFTKLNAAFLFTWIVGASTCWLCTRPRLPLLAAAGCVLAAAGYLFSQMNSGTLPASTPAWARYVPSTDVAALTLSTGIALLLPFLTQLKPQSTLGQRVNDLGGQLAAFSYTLYLTHFPLLAILGHYVPEHAKTMDGMSVLLFLLRMASCFVFAWLCYLPFEKQTRHLRKWLRKACTTRPSV